MHYEIWGWYFKKKTVSKVIVPNKPSVMIFSRKIGQNSSETKWKCKTPFTWLQEELGIKCKLKLITLN